MTFPTRCTSWPTFLALGLAVMTASCSSGSPAGEPSTDPVDQDEPGSTRGALAAYIATFDDGTSETSYYLRIDSGEELRLNFHTPVDVDPGTVIRVWGPAYSDGIDVSSYRVVDLPAAGIGSSSAPLVGAPALTDRNFCVVMVDLNGVTNAVTAAAANTQFFAGPTSINAYYRENSFGLQGVTGKVYGPFPYSMTTCANADTNTMATMMRAQVQMAEPGVACTQYAYIFSRTTVCAFGGLGALGSPIAPAQNTWYNGSISCVVTVQEPGHNFGMQHSSSLACPGATFADNPNTCIHSEYGDRFDPMGGGCRHMNVWQKEYQQWFGGCNSVRVTSTGDFDLFPTEVACNGAQALQVPMPVQRTFTRPAGGGGSAGTDILTSYYLEYRTAVGFDATMTPLPTVLLHVGADYKTLVTGTRARNTGIHTWLLDMHPTTSVGNQAFGDAGFRVGETFTDPSGSGLAFTVTAMDAAKATVHVEIPGGTGAPTCLDNTTFVAGPADCAAAPTTGPVADGGGIVPPPVRDAGPVVRADAGRDAVADSGSAPPGSGGAGGSGGAPGAVGAEPAEAGATVGAAGEFGRGGSVSLPDASGNPLSPGSGNPVEGGCSCRVGAASGPTHRGSDVAAGMVAIAALAGTRRRRRRRAAVSRG